ncbi:MAG: hypothetical protein HYT88_03995 [Candidatus Omnitrophica bacterium]|nr:hypothetical protein [Candidatus Omnitrophota bacterium]MBI2173947.1 hypothetical protein [Candidatus Omnitrophota bacterium]MBI3010373.1 hypothetical protein [Candidatus Omnitrophota bacterium]
MTKSTGGLRVVAWVLFCISMGIGGAIEVEAVAAKAVASPFVYRFDVNGTLEEAGQAQDSSSPYWWVSSGGRLILQGGLGMTIQGSLPAQDKWRLLYNVSNPVDTDSGLHPQNIFRLVTRNLWLNVSQTVSFRLTHLNMSDSPQRDAWSGIFLFNRYLDGNNLYYIGLRQDGTAVIKKKRYGVYYTLAQSPVYNGQTPYERDTTPNLMPGKQWTGLRSIVKTQSDGSVILQLFVDRNLTGNWQLALQTTDNNAGSDGAPILSQGYGGIRTDYMDVQFDDYTAQTVY